MAIYKYNDFEQTYDILYFESNRVYNYNIMKDIEQGEVIYGWNYIHLQVKIDNMQRYYEVSVDWFEELKKICYL